MMIKNTWIAVDCGTGTGGVACPSVVRLLDLSGVEVVSPRKHFNASVDKIFFSCCNKQWNKFVYCHWKRNNMGLK